MNYFFEILLPLLRHLGTHPLCITLTMIKRDKIRARRCSQAQRGYSFSIQRKRTQYLYICHCGQWSGGSDCFFSDCVKGIEWGGFSLPSLNIKQPQRAISIKGPPPFLADQLNQPSRQIMSTTLLPHLNGFSFKDIFKMDTLDSKLLRRQYFCGSFWW